MSDEQLIAKLNAYHAKVLSSPFEADCIPDAATRLAQLAAEVERYRQGMANWKACAEDKDASWGNVLSAKLASARTDALRYQEALVRYNDIARSFFQIANRIATEMDTHALGTNFGGFAETTEKLLKDTHALTNKARAALAATPSEPRGQG